MNDYISLFNAKFAGPWTWVGALLRWRRGILEERMFRFASAGLYGLTLP